MITGLEDFLDAIAIPCDRCNLIRCDGFCSVEPVLIFNRPIQMPCSPQEPYAFGNIFPGGCLVDADISQFKPIN